MPCHRMAGVAATLLAGVLVAGCGTRTGSAPKPLAGPTPKPDVAPSSTPKEALRSPEVGPSHSAAATAPTVPPLLIAPERATITSDDPGLQLLVGRQPGDGTTRDMTSKALWRVEPAGAATIEPGGYMRPVQGGEVRVLASVEGQQVAAAVKIEPRQERSWDFAQDVVPILTRLGCNTGACHGKADGQNGFHLSLAGYDPDGDYRALARDEGQRRVALLAPERSLFLTKATGRTAHGGGPRIAVGSPEYQLLLDWIRSGAPTQRGKSHGSVVRLAIEPGSARLAEPGTQQLRVVAEYTDGHRRDVTRQALFRSNDDSAATINPQGRAELLRRAEADLIVRYQSHVVSTRLATAINPGLAFDFAKVPKRNFIDDELIKRLTSLKVPPSPPASEAAFLRRISLDLTGEQPSPEQIRSFLADKDPEKRIKLVDRMLARQEFGFFWLIKLGDLLQISPARQGNGAYRYKEWIHRCLTENTPWDQVVLNLLTALGDPNDPDTGGPVNYALDALEPTAQAEQTAQRFLGLRMRCAQCHDHPFDIWTQDDYFGLAAFFAKVQRGGMDAGTMMSRASVSVNPKGQVVHLRTRQPVRPRLLGGKVIEVPEKDDPRKALARWMTGSENPYFARATANWVWAQFFGKGLVDPPDDMSRANPPVHPELLDALAGHLVATKFNLRDLIRTIATSEAYGLSSATVSGNEHDQRFFSHQMPRPLTAHQMADALAQATDVPNIYGTLGARPAIKIFDPATPSAILDAFGRCPRTNICTPVQTPPLSLKQSLLLIGGDTIESKVTSLKGYLASALKLELEPEELIENLYLRTVCRPPTPEELSRWTAELKQASSLPEAAQDLFWSLLNSREFAFNH